MEEIVIAYCVRFANLLKKRGVKGGPGLAYHELQEI
jgi:hypothetical protein